MSHLDPRTVLPPIQSSAMMDGLSPLAADPDRVSFQSAVSNPLQRAYQNTQQAFINGKAQIQVKAPGFFRKNGQFMLIMTLAIILSILCLIRIQNQKSLPISVGMMMLSMVMYFVWKYKNGVPATEAAFAGWMFALVLFISIVMMAVWVERNK